MRLHIKIVTRITGLHVDNATLPHRSDTVIQLTRRHVLRGGALALSASIIPAGGNSAPAAESEAAGMTAGVRIDRDGAVTVIVSQSEMGQGTSTTLAAAI